MQQLIKQLSVWVSVKLLNALKPPPLPPCGRIPAGVGVWLSRTIPVLRLVRLSGSLVCCRVVRGGSRAGAVASLPPPPAFPLSVHLPHPAAGALLRCAYMGVPSFRFRAAAGALLRSSHSGSLWSPQCLPLRSAPALALTLHYGTPITAPLRAAPAALPP